jgi:hypothetical protein
MYRPIKKYKVTFFLLFSVVVLLVFYLINHPQLPFEDASGLPINQITNQPVSFELQLKSLTNIQNKIFWLSRDGYGILVPVSVFVGSQISASSVDNVLRKKIVNRVRI